MRIGLSELGRRMVRLCVGLLLVSLGMLTACMFLATGGPVARSFTAWDGEPIVRLPARYTPYGGTLDDFLWISKSGDTYATTTAHAKKTFESDIADDPVEKERWGAEPPPRQVFEIEFRDTLTNKLVGRIKRFDHYPGQLCLSPDRSFLAIDCIGTTVWKFPEWNRVQTFSDGPWLPLTFSLTGKQLLVNKVSALLVWDTKLGREVLSFDLTRGEHHKLLWAGFFDDRGHPYALISDELNTPIELWNLVEGKKVPGKTIAADSKEWPGPRAEYCEAAMAGEVVAITYCCGPNGGLTRIWSLSSGNLLGSFILDDWLRNNKAISFEGRYFVHGTVREDKSLEKLVHSWPRLAGWIPKQFLTRKESICHDLSTGISWPGLPESERATFVQGADRLVIFNNDGHFEYDVPPHWQYFTPWAWAALGVWLSLIVFWWRLRKGRILCS